MTYLKHYPAFLCQVHHAICLFKRRGDRLLDQNRNTGFHEFAGNPVVENSRYCQADGVNIAYQVSIVCNELLGESVRKPPAGGSVDVAQSNQLNALTFRVDSGML